MSRPLRIEYPDAWYHVMNRGRRGESVFRKEEVCRKYRVAMEDLHRSRRGISNEPRNVAGNKPASKPQLGEVALDNTRISILNAAGEEDTSAVAQRIAQLLVDDLK